MNLLDPRYQTESARLLDQLHARGVYAPRLLCDLLSQAPEIGVNDILQAFDTAQERRGARDPQATIGATGGVERRAILRRWPDPPPAGIPF